MEDFPSIKISGFLNNLNELKDCYLDIIATASPNAFIKSEQLKKNATIYDIAQPQNISVNEIRNRPDLKIYDGGLVTVPQINKLPLGLPLNTVFACLAETILLALENDGINYSLGKVELEKIERIKDLATKYKFKPASLN
jgi:predicted amino acid dehydrogenase